MPPRTQDGSPQLFEAEFFAGFGASRFRPEGEVPLGRSLRSRGPERFKEFVRTKAPRTAGVYGMLDAKRRVIYIGKAKNLRSRLLSYFRLLSRHPKAGKIIDHTRTLMWEETHDEFGALLRELELIRRFRPRYNVVGMPGPRRYVYLCLGRSPAPYAYLTREPTGKETASYGPLVGRSHLEDALRRLNDWFRLRDCSQRIPLMFADQPELFPEDRAAKCLRHELNACLGPCTGIGTRAAYQKNVRAAKAFLDGRDRTVLDDLTGSMLQASAELRFEKASSLRDKLVPLTWLDERLTFLRNARRAGEFVHRAAGSDGRILWYLIHRGEVVATVREPVTAEAKQSTARFLQHAYALPAGETEITHKTVDSVLLVNAWFRRNPDDKAALLTRDEALLMCSTGCAIPVGPK